MNHEPSHPISKVLLPLVRGMCYHPDSLDLVEVSRDGTFEIQFFVHKADMPIVIGKEGRQATAIRNYGHEVGQRLKQQVDVSFIDGPGEREPRREFRFNPLFSKQDLDVLLKPIVELAFGRPMVCRFKIEAGIFKVHLEVEESEQSLAKAIGDIFFPFGRTQGRRIEIKAKDQEPLSK